MKCKLAIQNIDQYFNEDLAQLNPEIIEHLSVCPDCNLYFEKQKNANQVLARIINFEPALKDQGKLTDDIMKGLEEDVTKTNSGLTMNPTSLFQNVIFRRALSAAAILLFSLFVYEQYLVLDKVNRLETQYRNIPTNRALMNDTQIYKSWESRILKNYNHIKSNNTELIEMINSLGNNVSLSDLVSMQSGKYAFETREILEFYRQQENSSILKEYITTQKQNRHEN